MPLYDVTTIVKAGGTVQVLDPKPGSTQIISSGPAGPKGDPGVYVGTSPPADHSLLWVDTTGL